MIRLFHFPNHKIDTGRFDHLLHGEVVEQLERNIADYCGAKYAVSVSSATSAIYLSLLDKYTELVIPSCIPPVVINAIIASGNKFKFCDNVEWIGHSYILKHFGDYKIVDSAQRLERNQYKSDCKNNDLLIFSFYPTKPLPGIDGGIILSNDKTKIDALRILSRNGQTDEKLNWDRSHLMYGHKMYMNSMQAYIVNKNLEVYDKKMERCSRIQEYYNNLFNTNNTSKHLFRVNVENRLKLKNLLRSQEIGFGIHYNALHLNPFYGSKKMKLDRSEFESDTTISLPFHSHLKYKDIKKIYSIVRPYVIKT